MGSNPPSSPHLSFSLDDDPSFDLSHFATSTPVKPALPSLPRNYYYNSDQDEYAESDNLLALIGEPTPSTGSSTLVEKDETDQMVDACAGEKRYASNGAKGKGREDATLRVGFGSYYVYEDKTVRQPVSVTAEDDASSSSSRPSNKRRIKQKGLAAFIDEHSSSTPSAQHHPPTLFRTPHAPGAFPSSSSPVTPSSANQIHSAFAKYITGPNGALSLSAERERKRLSPTPSVPPASHQTPQSSRTAQPVLKTPHPAGWYAPTPPSARPHISSSGLRERSPVVISHKDRRIGKNGEEASGEDEDQAEGQGEVVDLEADDNSPSKPTRDGTKLEQTLRLLGLHNYHQQRSPTSPSPPPVEVDEPHHHEETHLLRPTPSRLKTENSRVRWAMEPSVSESSSSDFEPSRPPSPAVTTSNRYSPRLPPPPSPPRSPSPPLPPSTPPYVPSPQTSPIRPPPRRPVPAPSSISPPSLETPMGFASTSSRSVNRVKHQTSIKTTDPFACSTFSAQQQSSPPPFESHPLQTLNSPVYKAPLTSPSIESKLDPRSKPVSSSRQSSPLSTTKSVPPYVPRCTPRKASNSTSTSISPQMSYQSASPSQATPREPSFPVDGVEKEGAFHEQVEKSAIRDLANELLKVVREGLDDRGLPIPPRAPGEDTERDRRRRESEKRKRELEKELGGLIRNGDEEAVSSLQVSFRRLTNFRSLI